MPTPVGPTKARTRNSGWLSSVVLTRALKIRAATPPTAGSPVRPSSTRVPISAFSIAVRIGWLSPKLSACCALGAKPRVHPVRSVLVLLVEADGFGGWLATIR